MKWADYCQTCIEAVAYSIWTPNGLYEMTGAPVRDPAIKFEPRAFIASTMALVAVVFLLGFYLGRTHDPKEPGYELD